MQIRCKFDITFRSRARCFPPTSQQLLMWLLPLLPSLSSAIVVAEIHSGFRALPWTNRKSRTPTSWVVETSLIPLRIGRLMDGMSSPFINIHQLIIIACSRVVFPRTDVCLSGRTAEAKRDRGKWRGDAKLADSSKLRNGHNKWRRIIFCSSPISD